MLEILATHNQQVSFMPYDGRALIDSETWKQQLDPELIGGTASDFLPLQKQGELRSFPSDTPYLNSLNLLPGLLDMSRLDSSKQFFIPWLQATYLMVANRKCLQYLPEGADLNQLSYDQLINWASNIEKASGQPRTGFPASSKGLLHRFIQGFLYPSYTGTMIENFRHPDAITMWNDFDRLWQHCSMHSLSFSNMYEPMKSGEVWLGWDHSARIHRLLKEMPDDFICFPAPVGPKGRGSLLTLVGLALPAETEPERGMELIDFLLHADTQLQILERTGFIPVTGNLMTPRLSAYLQQLVQAEAGQVDAANAVVTSLPYGLGKQSDKFNKIYLSCFTNIILRHRDIPTVLSEQARVLRTVLQSTEMICRAPDGSGFKACEVE